MSRSILNQMVVDLEAHLTSEMDYNKLARKLGMSEFVMQRVFSVMAGLSMKEYLRRRRLSAAYAELKTTDAKVVELALKYGWSSPTAFARSFRKEFGCSPSECRREPGGSTKFQLFSMLEFNEKPAGGKLIEYYVKNLKSFTIYGEETSSPSHEKLLVLIREFYKRLKANGHYDMYNLHGRFGVDFPKAGSHHYLAGSPQKLKCANSSYCVNAGLYAIFEVNSLEQRDIIRTINFAETIWQKSTSSTLADLPIIEEYINGKTRIYVPLI